MLCGARLALAYHAAAAIAAASPPKLRSRRTRCPSRKSVHAASSAIASETTCVSSTPDRLSPCTSAKRAASTKLKPGRVPLVGSVPFAVLIPSPRDMLRAMVSIR